MISIHVPAWGTTISGQKPQQASIFQSTFPRGERLIVAFISMFGWEFQSTFPRGERQNQAKIASGSSISIHVPAWGTTKMRFGCFSARSNFNPRSRVGNDSKFSQIFFVFLCNKYNFSTFYYPFSLFFGVIHVTFLIFVVRILPAFYVYF